ncbi:MAG: hypothetical protein ACPL1K_06180, partial [Candidatus Kryptoniota bacterium]
FDPIVDIISDEVVVRAGELIDEEKAERIAELGIEKIKIRSVLSCKAERGVCAKCYGADLSRQRLVNFGEAVGVVAAQSIGEPGTQLTLRTFHVGGTVTRAIGPSRIISHSEGTVKFSDNLKVVMNRDKRMIVLSREGTIDIYDDKGRQLESNPVIIGTILHVEEGKKVRKDNLLATWDPYALPIIAEKEGIIRYRDVLSGKTIKEEFDPVSKITKRTVIEHQDNFEPRLEILEEVVVDKDGFVEHVQGPDKKFEIVLYDKPKDKDGKERKEIGRYAISLYSEILVKDNDFVNKGDIIARRVVGSHYLAVNTGILVEDGQKVLPGDIIAKTPRVVGRVQDITGGLPRVSELFEARPPKNPAILSEIEGTVSLYPGERGTRIIKITGSSGDQVKEYKVSFGKHLLVADG